MRDQTRKSGDFNVFEIEPFETENKKPLPYKKRDYYKVSLLEGNSLMQYADKVIRIPKQALIFTNPYIPYCWKHFESVHKGHYAIFSDDFFYSYSKLSKYSVFQPKGHHVFELDDEQLAWVKDIFAKMHKEIASTYEFKLDVLRMLTQELIHFAMKLKPSESQQHTLNAAERISTLFFELLGRQFPLDELHPRVELRTASEFAEKLNIHPNYLNRVLKETVDKTTSQIIQERILREAKILLKDTSWNISEIAYGLGFTEATHFNNFFKKQLKNDPWSI